MLVLRVDPGKAINLVDLRISYFSICVVCSSCNACAKGFALFCARAALALQVAAAVQCSMHDNDVNGRHIPQDCRYTLPCRQHRVNCAWQPVF